MKTYFVNGRFVSEDRAVIPVTDLSVLRGYGVCDIMRTYRGRPFFLEEHASRLQASAAEIGLSLPWSKDDIIRYVLETLGKNHPIDEVNIRIVITGGSSTDYFTPQGNPRLIILLTDLKKLPETWYEDGVRVVTYLQERPMPDAKITSYIPAAMALKDAHKKNAIEAIYINRNQHVLEGTTSNLFAFFNDILVTPSEDVLKGITRKATLSLARNMFQIKERKISLEELLSADEIFITGTNKGIVPVIQVDETRIGSGRPGRHTRELMSRLETHTNSFIRQADQNDSLKS